MVAALAYSLRSLVNPATTRMRPDGPLWGRLWPAYPAALFAAPAVTGTVGLGLWMDPSPEQVAPGPLMVWSGVAIAVVAAWTWVVGRAVVRHPKAADFGPGVWTFAEQADATCRRLESAGADFLIPEAWDNFARASRGLHHADAQAMSDRLERLAREAQQRSPDREIVREYIRSVEELGAKLREDPKELD